MRLCPFLDPHITPYPCARKRFPPPTNISRSFSDWRVVVCLDRSWEPGICQGRLTSIRPYRSQNQNRHSYVSSLRRVGVST
jgi:hypothetical protein